jgi:hypothetical protein
MNSSFRRSFFWPLALAAVFFSIPVLLAFSYPISFWMGTDYETLGLANALNMAYRLGDRQMYEAVGMAYHPGVPFYLMSWLALALAGYPVASGEINFFDTVLDHVEDFHRVMIWLGALTGAVGVYVFARTAHKLVPVSVTATGLLVWLFSTPATLLMFMSPGIESFAILINGLFFAVMVPLAYEEKVDPSIVVFAGCVGAFAYLNKLSYVYIPLALYAALIAKLPVCRAALLRGTLLHIVFLGTLALVVLAAAYLIIGWEGFRDVWRYHQSIIWGSKLYGTGDQTVVSKGEIWRAIAEIPGGRAYAVPIALVSGIILVVGGVATAIKQAGRAPIVVLSIGTGVAAVLSALIVLKHYDIHYTAGISATLPSCVVCFYLLTKSWGLKFRFAGAAVAAMAVLLMAAQIKGTLIYYMQSRTTATAQAKADLEEINSYLAGNKRAVEFAYKAPFPQYGEGFIVTYGSVPRLTYDYFRSRPLVMSSMVAGLVTRDVGAYVIDKSYFRDVESVKAAENLALLDPKPVRFKDGDKLIELRTVFLLIRG